MTYVGPGFTRKPPKYERFIRPMGLRFTKAHVTHPELKCTFNLEIIGVKKNPNGPMYTSMGVITKGTVIELCCRACLAISNKCFTYYMCLLARFVPWLFSSVYHNHSNMTRRGR